MEIKVKIKKLHPDAVIPYKKYDNDYCYDCVATSCKEIAPNVYRYGLGFAIQVDQKDRLIKLPIDKLLAIEPRPRSSIWEHGMLMSNSIGTVDEGYTGEVSVVLYHIFPDMPKYEVGDRVCQIKIGFTLPLDFMEVSELDQMERGLNGYGSTNK